MYLYIYYIVYIVAIEIQVNAWHDVSRSVQELVLRRSAVHTHATATSCFLALAFTTRQRRGHLDPPVPTGACCVAPLFFCKYLYLVQTWLLAWLLGSHAFTFSLLVWLVGDLITVTNNETCISLSSVLYIPDWCFSGMGKSPQTGP